MTEESFRPSRLLAAVPGLLALLLVFAGAAPIGAPLVGPVLPALGLIAVFVWAIQRPDLLPHWLAFLLGLAQDLVTGGPLGLNALVLLLVQGVCASQRRFLFGRPFLLGWFGFAVIALPVALVQWAIASAYFTAIVPVGDLLIQYAATVAVYPLVAAPMMLLAARISRSVPA